MFPWEILPSRFVFDFNLFPFVGQNVFQKLAVRVEFRTRLA